MSLKEQIILYILLTACYLKECMYYAMINYSHVQYAALLSHDLIMFQVELRGWHPTQKQNRRNLHLHCVMQYFCGMFWLYAAHFVRCIQKNHIAHDAYCNSSMVVCSFKLHPDAVHCLIVIQSCSYLCCGVGKKKGICFLAVNVADVFIFIPVTGTNQRKEVQREKKQCILSSSSKPATSRERFYYQLNYQRPMYVCMFVFIYYPCVVFYYLF